MATNNAVDTTLSGQSGTGSFAGTTSPTFVTPTLGAATATSLAFSPTTGGIIGTTAADNAAAGDVGQVISSVIASGSATALTNNIAKDVTSISLTAGDWDVWGNVAFLLSGSGAAGYFAWSSTTSATLPDASLYSEISLPVSTFGSCGMNIPTLRYNVSGTTTVFLSCAAAFASGSVSACGGIYARRRR